MIVFFVCGSCFLLENSTHVLHAIDVNKHFFNYFQYDHCDWMNMQCVGPLQQWDHLKETRLAFTHLANGR